MIAVDSHAEGAARSPGEWTREELIEKVRAINPSASVEYLAGFEMASLGLYLAHLEWAALPRKARWHRPGDTRGLRVYESAQ